MYVGGLWFCHTQMSCANVTHEGNGDITDHKSPKSLTTTSVTEALSCNSRMPSLIKAYNNYPKYVAADDNVRIYDFEI
jgi:hypothetical protein